MIKIRCKWHPIAGGITAWLCFTNIPAAYLSFIGFFVYQFYQDRNNLRLYNTPPTGDGKLPDSHIDIQEWLIGFVPTALAISIIGGIS